MIFRRNKKGQAAIEFLMTYGWMLLVVLIVGALIFSFVDFGALLPNKLELSNNLRGDPTGSVAYSSGSSVDANQVKVVFRFNGAKRQVIDPFGANIITELGDQCNATNLTNLDTKGSVIIGSTTPFLNGHDGLINFNCSSITGGLLAGDSLTGKISINVEDPKSGLKIPSSGSIRLQIT